MGRAWLPAPRRRVRDGAEVSLKREMQSKLLSPVVVGQGESAILSAPYGVTLTAAGAAAARASTAATRLVSSKAPSLRLITRAATPSPMRALLPPPPHIHHSTPTSTPTPPTATTPLAHP